jgi:glycosyltransferase involved in cell wall biosynthesis
MTQPVVLHINTARGWRGGERQVLLLTERLNALGVRSIVASPADQPLAAAVKQRGLPFVPFAPRGEWDILAVKALRGIARTHDVDILNTHDGHANTLGAFARVGRQHFVITRRVHHRLRNNFISRWKFRSADRVIAISNAVGDVMRESGVSAERIVVIHSGVDPNRARIPATPAVLTSLGLTPGRPFALLVGLAGHKDPFTFLRALAFARKDLPELQAVIVGQDKLASAVQHEIDKLELGQHVFLTGHRNDVDAIMCASSLVVMSSNAEGLGTAALDAMWARKPLVATRTAAIVDFAGHERNALLVPVGDASALGRQMVRALQEPDLREHIIKNASETVAAFSADATARATLAVYASLTQARNHPVRPR